MEELRKQVADAEKRLHADIDSLRDMQAAQLDLMRSTNEQVAALGKDVAALTVSVTRIYAWSAGALAVLVFLGSVISLVPVRVWAQILVAP